MNKKLKKKIFEYSLVLIFACSINAVFSQSSVGWQQKWSKYIGGSGYDEGSLLKYYNGKLYIISTTTSSDFPVTDGSVYHPSNDGVSTTSDIVISCLDTISGNIIWSKYIGGSGNEIMVNNFQIDNGKIYLIGGCYSLDFLTTRSNIGNAVDANNIFACKLDANTGNLDWSELIGGSSNDGITSTAIANGRLYFCGGTLSSDFPLAANGLPNDIESNVLTGCLDMSTGNLLWAKIYRGQADDVATDFVIQNNNLFVTGYTFSSDFPVTNGSQLKGYIDPFVISINKNNGTTNWAGYYGGSGGDEGVNGISIKVLNNNKLVLVSYSEAIEIPKTDNTYSVYRGDQDVLIVTLDINSGNTIWMRKLGGEDIEEPYVVATENNTIYIGGYTLSNDFPVTDNNPPTTRFHRSFVSSVNESGTINWSRIFEANAYNATTSEFIIKDNKLCFLLYSKADYYSSITDDSRKAGSNTTNDYILHALDKNTGASCSVSYLGGSEDDFQSGYSISYNTENIAMDSSASCPVLYFIGSTSSADFPSTGTSQNSGSQDAIINKVVINAHYDTLNKIQPITQTLCLGGYTKPITGNRVTPPSVCFEINYQWQIANSNNGPWTNIANATQQDYLPQTFVTNKWYRRLVIKDPTASCYGSQPDTISKSNISSVLVNNFNVPVVNAGADVYTCPSTASILGGNPSVSGGLAPYTFSWDNTDYMSNPNDLNPTVVPINTTTYTLTVKDSRGCENKDEVIVNVIKANAAANHNECLGINAPVQIGAPQLAGAPVRYTWSPATGLSCSDCASPYASPVVNTTYTLTTTVFLQDGDSCQTQDNVTVIKPQPLIPNFAGADIVTCYSASNRFLIGTPPQAGYEYTWSPGLFLEANNSSQVYFNSGNFLPVQNPMTYYLTARYNGCTWYDTMQVFILFPDAGKDGCGPRIIGGGNSHINIPATYQWTAISGSNNIIGPSNTPTVSVGASTSGMSVYQLKVCYRGVCCTDEVSVGTCGGVCGVDINVLDPNTCPVNRRGDSLHLQATGIIPDINPASYTYTWSPCIGLRNCTGRDVYMYDTVTRTYTVTLSSTLTGITCNNSIDVNMPGYSPPVFDGGGPYYICNGQNVQIGAATVAGYSYLWKGPASFLSNQSNPVVTLPGTYIATVTQNISGCTFKDTVKVITSNTINNAAGPDIYICSGAIIKLGVNNPNSNSFTYQWLLNGNVTYVNGTTATIPQPQITTAVSTKMILKLTDIVSGCFLYDTTNIIINTGGIIPKALDKNVCAGNTIKIGNDSIPGATYLWTSAAGLACTACAQPTVNPISVTDYYVTVQLPGNCASTAKDTIRVNVNALPNFNITSPVLKCRDETVPLNPALSGSCSGCTYKWTPNSGIDYDTLLNPSTYLPSPITYNFTVTNQNNCSNTKSVQVNIKQVNLDAGNNRTICLGEKTSLGNSTNSTTTTWSPNNNLNCTVCANPEFYPTNTGVYTFTANYTQNGCTSTKQVTITVQAPSTTGITDLYSICKGTCIDIGTSSELGYTYKWRTSAGILNLNTATIQVCPLTDTMYYLSIINDITRCTYEIPIRINVINSPVPIVTIPDYTACIGEQITFNPAVSTSGNYSYYWSPSIGLNNPLIKNPVLNTNIIGAGNSQYFLKITDNTSGCFSTTDTSNIVILNSQVAVSITGNNILCNNSKDTLKIVGVYDSIRWNTGLSGSQIVVSAAGTYSATVYLHGCTATSSVQVVQCQQQICNPIITGNKVICAGDSVLLNAGSGFTSYQWNTGATSQTIFAKNSGKYTVITTGNNCSGKDSVTVVVNPLPTPVITGNTTLCFGDSVRLSVAGQFDSVRWSTNQTSFNINVTLGGGYSVKAYKNGCTGTANTTITVQNLSVNITGDSVICAGASAVLQANSGFAHYLWNTNDTTKSLTINTAGVYSLMGTSNEGCKATDTFRVSAISENYFLSSHNESICIGDTAVFFLSRNNNGVITVADTFNFAQTGRHEITYQTTKCGLFKDSVFVNSKPVKKPVISGDTSVCVNQSVTLDAGIGFDTYIWQPTGEQTQGITTNILGTHVVTTTKQGFCKDSSFVTLVHAKSPTPFTLGNDTSFCGEFSKVLTAGNKPVLWNTGEVANQITITKAGEYIAQDSTRCGVIRDTIIIKNNPLPVLKLGSDVEFCDSIQLSAGNKALQSILWNTYDTTYTIIVKNEGMYAVTIMDSNFCKNVDSVFAKKVCDYTIYIPTAFSPNNDGINDIIVPLSKAKGIFILSFQIYNRWGEKVFESADFYPNDIRFGWNGIYKNAECPLDSYVYLLKTQFPDNTYKDYKGIIVLLK